MRRNWHNSNSGHNLDRTTRLSNPEKHIFMKCSLCNEGHCRRSQLCSLCIRRKGHNSTSGHHSDSPWRQPGSHQNLCSHEIFAPRWIEWPIIGYACWQLSRTVITNYSETDTFSLILIRNLQDVLKNRDKTARICTCAVIFICNTFARESDDYHSSLWHTGSGNWCYKRTNTWVGTW